MEVILLERVGKLGQMGDVVRVKDGFARNYLLPRARRCAPPTRTARGSKTMKVELEARNLEQKGEAEKVAKKLDGQSFTVLRQAAEGGQLYGSVSPRDIAALVSEKGFAVNRAQIALNTPIKTIGLHKVPIALHPEVEVDDQRHGRAQCRRGRAHRPRRGHHRRARRGGGSRRARRRDAAEAFFEPEAAGEAVEGRRRRTEPRQPRTADGDEKAKSRLLLERSSWPRAAGAAAAAAGRGGSDCAGCRPPTAFRRTRGRHGWPASPWLRLRCSAVAVLVWRASPGRSRACGRFAAATALGDRCPTRLQIGRQRGGLVRGRSV